MFSKDPVTSRRDLLKASAGLTGALVVGFNFEPGKGRMKAMAATKEFIPNAFVKIDSNSKATIYIKHLEMGQGVNTGLATILAEELDIDWKDVKAEAAPANADLYKNLFFGIQATGGSTAVANSYMQLREAGAKARYLLVAAAAKSWGVNETEITTRDSVVYHKPSGKKAKYGELATLASTLTAPETVALKDPSKFEKIGKSMPRLDTFAKSNGTAKFGIDIKLPGMLTAVVARPPVFGAKLKSVDSKSAKAMKGVKSVVTIPSGVAVIAVDFWTAKSARDALKLEWSSQADDHISSEKQLADYKKAAEQHGQLVESRGDVVKGAKQAKESFVAEFEFPYLAHAPMEPLNCVIKFDGTSADIWAGEQFQTIDQGAAAGILGLKPEDVSIHTTYAGGSFGRRATPQADYISEASHIAKAAQDLKAPIRVVWTREDDIRGGYYRPSFVHRVEVGVKDKSIVSWDHRIVGQSILIGTPFEKSMVKDGIDEASVEGVKHTAYDLKNFKVSLHTTNSRYKVPVLWWRSVGNTHTAYVMETVIDDIAFRLKENPVDLRRQLLKKHPRYLGVLETAAKHGRMDQRPGKNRGRGIAVHFSFNSYVAQVVDVSVKQGEIRIDKVVCAVDCGKAINPDVIRAQMEGGIGFGLSAALHSKLTFTDGRVNESNFHDYRVLRLSEMPEIEVHIINSEASPTGVGEPGVPVIAPALSNAIFDATGTRIRSLPMHLDNLVSADRQG